MTRPDGTTRQPTLSRQQRLARLLAAASLAWVVISPWDARGQGTPPRQDASADFVLTQVPVPLPEPGARIVDSVKAEALAAHIKYLASPALEGRGLGSQGLAAAAEYVASGLARAGIAPLPVAGSGKEGSSYFQSVPLREVADPAGVLRIEQRTWEEVRTRSFESGTDCLIPPLPPRSQSASVVFAGFGIREKSPERDDYRGLDVRGKVVLVRAGLPPGEAWKSPALVSKYASSEMPERFRAKVETAKELGAVGVLAVEEAGWVAEILTKEKRPERGFFRIDDADGSDGDPFVIRVSPAVARLLLGGEIDGKRTVLPGTRVTVESRGTERLTTSRNVIGFLEGSDPEKKSEAVIVGAHMDHLGKVRGVVHPGADDNASGVAALLEIATVLASAPARPARSVLFIFWTGEEDGHIGSGHYVRNPLWPLEKTPVYVNLDMIGHPWLRKEIEDLVKDNPFPASAEFLSKVSTTDFAEPGVASFRPDFRPLLAQAGRAAGLSLHFDWTDGRFGGSDYREFARLRIPFIRFFGNFFPGYHEPADTAGALDARQVQKLARLAAATVWIMAAR